jgi:hypothetical protein
MEYWESSDTSKVWYQPFTLRIYNKCSPSANGGGYTFTVNSIPGTFNLLAGATNVQSGLFNAD